SCLEEIAALPDDRANLVVKEGNVPGCWQLTYTDQRPGRSEPAIGAPPSVTRERDTYDRAIRQRHHLVETGEDLTRNRRPGLAFVCRAINRHAHHGYSCSVV